MVRDTGRLSLDAVAFPVVSRSQIAKLVKRYRLGVEPDDVRRLPSTGIMHAVYALGEHLVLRIPKQHPEAIADTYTGSVAAPVAAAAGVRTPPLVVFDDERDIVPVPLLVFSRAAGEPLVDLGAHPQDLGRLWRELGAELALLHRGVTVCDDPLGRLDRHEYVTDYEALVGQLRAAGIIGGDAAAWLTSVLARLEPVAQGRGRYRRFVHGDVQPSNVLAVGGRYSAIIDWDDAGWADPVVDFRSLPLRVAGLVLEGYRSVGPVDGDDSVEQRLVWDKLTGAVRRLWRQPRPNDGTVSGTPAGPLLDLLAAAVDSDVAIMRHLGR